jgi:hypothetical protein
MKSDKGATAQQLDAILRRLTRSPDCAVSHWARMMLKGESLSGPETKLGRGTGKKHRDPKTN